MDLYVVTTSLPGPGAAALLDEVPTVADASPMHGRTVALADAKAAVAGVCEFVELETADGAGVGPASGIGWSEHPTDGGLHRLGPFRATVVPDGFRVERHETADRTRFEVVQVAIRTAGSKPYERRTLGASVRRSANVWRVDVDPLLGDADEVRARAFALLQAAEECDRRNAAEPVA